MSSHAQDQGTQTAASTGAQANDAQLAANAKQNQDFSNQTRTTLFGTYNPATNTYSGGTQSKFLDPASMDTKNLTGSYANEYNTLADQTAQGAQRAVGTTMQDMASRGMGKTPTGFAADQERQAYQTQAGENGANYSGLFAGQHAEDVNNYTNATNLLNSNATGAANLSLSGNQAAAGNYSNLYNTASQQVQNPWAVAGQTLAGMGSAAAGFMPRAPAPAPAGCWVAAEIFGGWDDPRTIVVREWIFGPFRETRLGAMVCALYLRFGEALAVRIRTDKPLRWMLTRLFNAALRQARKG